MTLRYLPVRAGLLAAILALALPPVWAQSEAPDDPQVAGSAPAAPGDGSSDAGASTGHGTSATLPGVILERNVFVPVDGTGHPASNEYIVVERRKLVPNDEEAQSSTPSQGASADVPTRFILVPQEEDDDSDDAQ